MVTLDEHSQELLSFGEWPVTMEKRIGLVAWAVAEDSNAEWNPWDTTEPAPGATDYNAAGVKNYPTQQIGIEATYATLMNGRYSGVLAVLHDEGASALSLAQAIGASPWGTGDFSKVVEAVKADPQPYLQREVAGSSSPPPIPEPVTIEGEDPMTIYRVPNGGEYILSGGRALPIRDPSTTASLVAAGWKVAELDQATADAWGMS